MVWQWAYSAFGDEQPTTAATRFTGPSTVPTIQTTTVAAPVTFNLRFPGQHAETEPGLFYNDLRTYNPTTGRYTQSDPIGLGGGWSRFEYVNGNPLMYADPSGLSPLGDAGAVLGGLGGRTAGAIGGELVFPPGGVSSAALWGESWAPGVAGLQANG